MLDSPSYWQELFQPLSLRACVERQVSTPSGIRTRVLTSKVLDDWLYAVRPLHYGSNQQLLMAV